MGNADPVQTRARSGRAGGSVNPPPVSDAASGLLNAVGRSVRIGGRRARSTGAPPPPMVDEKAMQAKAAADAKAAEDALRKQRWTEINAVTATLDREIEILAMLPGQLPLANGFRKRRAIVTVDANAASGALALHLDTLVALERELNGEIDRLRAEMGKRFAETKVARRDYELMHGKLVVIEAKLADYPPDLVLTSGIPRPGAALKAAQDRRALAEAHFAREHYGEATALIREAYASAKATADGLAKLDDKLAGGLFFPGELGKANKALGLLREAVESAAEDAGEEPVTPFRPHVDKFHAELLLAADKKAPDKLVESLRSRIETVTKMVVVAVETHRARRERILVGEAVQRDLVIDRGPLRPQAEISATIALLDGTVAAVARHDFDRAEKDLAAATGTIATWASLGVAGSEPWNVAIFRAQQSDFVKPLETEKARAQKFLEMAHRALEPSPTPKSIVDLLADQMTRYTGNPPAFPLPLGIDAVARAKAANDDFAARLAAYDALAKVRKELAAGIADARRRAEAEIAVIRQAVEKGGQDAAALPSYDAPLKTAIDGWAVAEAQEIEEARLRAAHALAVKQLDAVAAKAKADAASGNVAAAIAEAKFGKVAAAYDVAFKDATDKVAALVEVDFAKGDTRRVELDAERTRYLNAVAARKPEAAQKAVEAIAAIARDAGTDTAAADADLTAALTRFHADWSATKLLLAELTVGAKGKDYAGVVATLTADVQALVAVAKSRDASVLRTATAEIAALKSECDRLKQLLQPVAKGAAGDLQAAARNTLVSIDSLGKRLASIKLEHDLVAKLEAPALAALQADKKAIAGALKTARLTESADRIDALEQGWSELRASTAQRQAAIERFRQAITVVRKDFLDHTSGEAYPDYFAAITGKLKAIDEAAKSTGEIDQGELDRITKEIARIRGGKQPDMTALADNGAKADTLREELERTQFSVELAAVRGKLASLDAVAKAIADPEARKSFKQQQKQIAAGIDGIAGSNASAILAKIIGDVPPGTFANKREQLRGQAGNIDRLIAYPMGLETHARGQILKTVAAWDDAAKKFGERLSELFKSAKTRIEANADELGETSSKDLIDGVKARIDRLRGMVPPGTITASAKAVVAATDDAGARQAREVALREVGRLRANVEGTPFRAIAANPFDDGILTNLSALSASLFDVETNLTISL